MFWTIVLALVFVFFILPIVLAFCGGALAVLIGLIAEWYEKK